MISRSDVNPPRLHAPEVSHHLAAVWTLLTPTRRYLHAHARMCKMRVPSLLETEVTEMFAAFFLHSIAD